MTMMAETWQKAGWPGPGAVAENLHIIQRGRGVGEEEEVEGNWVWLEWVFETSQSSPSNTFSPTKSHPLQEGHTSKPSPKQLY